MCDIQALAIEKLSKSELLYLSMPYLFLMLDHLTFLLSNVSSKLVTLRLVSSHCMYCLVTLVISTFQLKERV